MKLTKSLIVQWHYYFYIERNLGLDPSSPLILSNNKLSNQAKLFNV